MVFKVENIEGEAELLVTKEYGKDNCDLTVDMLTEVFVVVYTYLKKGVKEAVEIYTFTTDFEQAFKRFKLLPACKCLLKRFLTDDENLINLAVTGTKPKVEMSDELNTTDMTVQLKEIMDQFSDDGVDRSGFTVRELTSDEFSLLESEKEIVIPITNNGEQERKESTGREDIQDYEPEQQEVVHWVNNITPGEEVVTASESKKELGEEEQVSEEISKL